MPVGGTYFVYNGVASRQHGLQFAYLNTSPQDAPVEGGREYVTSKLPGDDRFFILGRKADSPYSREVEIISEEPLSPAKQRELIRWLFYQPDYRKLVILSPEYAGIYYNCVFKEETTIAAGDGCHGWKCTLQCDSGFAWEEKKTQVFNNLTDGQMIKINNTSDEIGYLKPAVSITAGNTPIIQIQNLDDNNNTVRFDSLLPGDLIQMDEFGQITSNSSTVHWYDHYNHRRLFLVNGENRLSITGQIARLEISYQNKRRFGL